MQSDLNLLFSSVVMNTCCFYDCHMEYKTCIKHVKPSIKHVLFYTSEILQT